MMKYEKIRNEIMDESQWKNTMLRWSMKKTQQKFLYYIWLWPKQWKKLADKASHNKSEVRMK